MSEDLRESRFVTIPVTKGDAIADDKPQDGGEVLKMYCEVYSRCVGYLRPVSSWNIDKRQEFHDRKVFKLPKSVASDDV